MTTPNIPFDLIVLGAGAAGMMAAVAAGDAARDPATGKSHPRIAIFEKNAQPGIKILVCGGGRCNFTNAGTVEFLIEQFGRNGRFLTPALRHLDNEGLRDWFARAGVPSHEEHDGKIYPDSNQAKSIVDALVRRMRDLGVHIFAGPQYAATTLEKMPATLSPSFPETPPFFRIITAGGEAFTAHTLVLAVGGMSYQRMGTTGDGYTMARALGHSLIPPRPAIVGLLVQEEWVKSLSGLAVENVEVRIVVEGILPRLATGKPTPSVNDLLFTHFGLSGPAILNPSEIVAELLEKFLTVTLRIDFRRDTTHDQLAALLRGWQQREGKKRVRTLLATLLPVRLAEMFCQLEDIREDQPCAILSASQIHRLLERLKNSRFTVTGTRGFKEAMVTAGGIALAEVDPRTMESKKVPNLFLTGEVLDLTGPSGGYNLQLAFSTGHLAGSVIARHHFPTAAPALPSSPLTETPETPSA